MSALSAALTEGAPLTAVSRVVSYAAALRVARFHTSNEFSDWITVLHTFTHANAVHQLLPAGIAEPALGRRAAAGLLGRGVRRDRSPARAARAPC